jgi:flagellar biosynthesis protein FliQ
MLEAYFVCSFVIFLALIELQRIIIPGWTSNLAVFIVAGLVVSFLLAVVLIEKFTCVPKKMSHFVVLVTGNKMLHQLMAIANVLTLLSCVLLPMVPLNTVKIYQGESSTCTVC